MSGDTASNVFTYTGSSIIHTITTTPQGQKIQDRATFVSATTGTFVSTLNADKQTGTFARIDNTNLPSTTLASTTILVQILAGDNPFASMGIATLTLGVSTYMLNGDDVHVSDSNGSYSYTHNRRGGYAQLTLNNDVLGTSNIFTLIYKNANSGAFATRNNNIRQAGLFTIK